jgi:hypothetical protein
VKEPGLRQAKPQNGSLFDDEAACDEPCTAANIPRATQAPPFPRFRETLEAFKQFESISEGDGNSLTSLPGFTMMALIGSLMDRGSGETIGG